MQIKVDRNYIIQGTFLSFSPILVMIGVEGFDWTMITLMFIPSVFMFVNIVLPCFRVVDMEESGCTISYLWWKRKYLWSEFELISKGRWKTASQYGIYVNGVFFSLKAKNKNGKKMTGSNVYHSWEFLNCFYVILLPEKKKNFYFLYPYGIDEKTFFNTFEKLGIEWKS